VYLSLFSTVFVDLDIPPRGDSLDAGLLIMADRYFPDHSPPLGKRHLSESVPKTTFLKQLFYHFSDATRPPPFFQPTIAVVGAWFFSPLKSPLFWRYPLSWLQPPIFRFFLVLPIPPKNGSCPYRLALPRRERAQQSLPAMLLLPTTLRKGGDRASSPFAPGLPRMELLGQGPSVSFFRSASGFLFPIWTLHLKILSLWG